MSAAQPPEDATVTAPANQRVPIRRRPMPCPHCDVELSDPELAVSAAELAASPDASCPACGGSLRPVEVAGFWRRTAAGFVDLAILAVTAGPIVWGLHRLVDPQPVAPGARGLDRFFSLVTADFGLLLGRAGPFLVLATAYFMVTLFWTGRTFGQRLLGIRVIDRHGQPPGLLVTAIRTLAQLVGTLAAAFGPLWMAIDSERRAVHDVVAGTYVVRSA